MLKLNNNQQNYTKSETACANIISNYVGVYVFIILAVFPLFVTRKYFNILEDKFYLFWVSTAVVTALSIITALVFYIKERSKGRHSTPKHKSKEFRSEEDRSGKAGLGLSVKELVGKLRLEDIFFVGFMLVSIISTVFSKWQYEAFWGNMGRYQGLFLWIWYAASYVLISRFFRFKKVYIDIFLIAGALLAAFAVTDYFQLDIFGWQAAIADAKVRTDFSSTIGNVNSLTAVLGMYLGVSALMFVSEKKHGKTIFYYFITALMFMALAAAQSDNAVLGIALLFGLLPFFAWKTKGGLLRYFMLLAVFVASLCLLGSLTSLHGAVIHEAAFGVLLVLANKAKSLLGILLLVLIFICILIDAMILFEARRGNKTIVSCMQETLSRNFRIAWGILCLAFFILLAMMFYDANHGGHPEFFAPLSNIFIFDDNWGTFRGYNWKMLLGYMGDFSLFNKLFGAGPESYGIYTKVYDYYSTIDFMKQTIDSPHNEFLQYLFCTGILGVITYYGGLLIACVKMLFSKFSGISSAFAFAVLMYTAQSLINISVPVATPLAIVLLAIGVNVAHKGERLSQKADKTEEFAKA
ncbi:MAG: O-antigen ligase family protein [Eubacteriales bacterium]|nr:O-antigen ligase family protein [Eubacteriales bacterium]